MCVWLTIASGALVFAEPAPVDLAMAGLIILLPVAGLAPVKPSLLLYFGVWLIIAAAGFWASTQGSTLTYPTTHTAITLFLSVGAFVIACFVALRPQKHASLILNAQLVAATLAAIAGLIGYLGLLPGAHELFTKFGRASGPFKDPNVFGPFVGFAALYALQLCLNAPLRRLAVPFAMLGFLILGLFLSFSRGAWISFALSIVVFGYLQFVTARGGAQRLKLISLALLAVIAVALAMFAALQFDKTATMLQQRASLSQTYDTEHNGRFDGQLKAARLLLQHPLGLAAGEFQTNYHHEDVHNVYLVMFLNAGWLGGLCYLIAVLIPLVVGLRQAFLRVETQAMFHVIYAAYVGTLGEGIIIDTDHWRHFYLLLALVMGLWAASRRSRSGVQAAADPSISRLPPSLVAALRRQSHQARLLPVATDRARRKDDAEATWVVSGWRPLR